MSERKHFDFEGGVEGGLPPQLVRWIQPPQITYFINSMDKEGNHNVAPVTMGTIMCMNGFWIPFAMNACDAEPPCHTYSNLAEVPECVLSYVGSDLLSESWIAALPVPRGISELEVAGLTPLPSKNVRPCGIQECKINLEMRIVSIQEFGEYNRMFLGKVVAVSVESGLYDSNSEKTLKTGMTAIDPLFEVLIENTSPTGPPRLYYMKLDHDSLCAMSDEIGSSKDWLGTFEQWMDSECERGRIDSQERSEIFSLSKQWSKDTHPVRNSKVKKQLTQKLREIVARPREKWASPCCGDV